MGSCPDTDIDPKNLTTQNKEPFRINTERIRRGPSHIFIYTHIFPNGLRKLCGVCLIVKLCFIVDYIPRGKIWISVFSKNKRFYFSLSIFFKYNKLVCLTLTTLTRSEVKIVRFTVVTSATNHIRLAGTLSAISVTFTRVV